MSARWTMSAAEQRFGVLDRAGRAERHRFVCVADGHAPFSAIAEIFDDPFRIMFDGHDNLVDPLLFESGNQMFEPWTIANRCHRFRKPLGERSHAGAETSSEQQCFHASNPSRHACFARKKKERPPSKCSPRKTAGVRPSRGETVQIRERSTGLVLLALK